MRGRKGEYRKELAELQKKGFLRAKVDGKFYDIGATPVLDKKLKHDIEIVVDRIVVKPDIGNRLPDSIETALKLADGLLLVEFADEKEKDAQGKEQARQIVFSSKFACPVSGFTIPEIEPRLFSFNNPHGACPQCDGLGVQNYFDEALVVPDVSLNLKKGAIAPWAKSSSPYYLQTLEAIARHYKVSMNDPWEDLPRKVQKTILHGSGEEAIKFTYDDGMRRYDTKRRHPQHGAPHQGNDSGLGAGRIGALSGGSAVRGLPRLSPEARNPVGQDRRPSHRPGLRNVHPPVRRLVRDIDKKLNKQQQEIAVRILKEIRGAAEIPQQCGAGLPDPGAVVGHAFPAAKASASGWRRRSVRA